MKRILQLLMILFFPLAVFSQDKYLARLPVSGAVSTLGISSTEELWIATKAGNTYHTRQVGELWNIGPFGSADPNNYTSGNTFERVNFFSDDTLMISGFIQDAGKENFVYWSGNHGKNWTKVVFGKSSWLDAAYINNNGKAWMSGSSQLIYYSEDKGKTWKTFGKVEARGNLRFNTIYFSNNEKTGLFGATWNVLYKTPDNCKSWEKLPTPLDQKKYKRISKDERPEIEKIRIFGSYYITNQQNKVFITRSDHIDWIYLPDAVDFEVTENDNLYIVNTSLKVERYDSGFKKTWQSDQKLEDIPRAIGVRNNKLFALTSEFAYKISPGEFISSALFTNEIEIPEPHLKVTFGGELFGFENRDILHFDPTKKRWGRFMTLDFSISNATLFDNKLLIAGGSPNKYYSVNYKARSIAEFTLPANLFSNKEVIAVHFENGSQGCFSSSNSRRTYIKKANKFIVDERSSSAKFLAQSATEIDETTIKALIWLIEKSRFSKVSLKDLDITGADIKGFKTFIDSEETRIKKSGIDLFAYKNLYAFPGEYTDFGFYKSVADTLFNISDQNVNNAFWQAYGNWSTTAVWSRVIFVFKDGKKIIVQNSDDHPNYLYAPWSVNYDGLQFGTNSIKLGQAIDKITGGQFFDKDARDKKYAIFKLADYLYRKKLAER